MPNALPLDLTRPAKLCPKLVLELLLRPLEELMENLLLGDSAMLRSNSEVEEEWVCPRLRGGGLLEENWDCNEDK